MKKVNEQEGRGPRLWTALPALALVLLALTGRADSVVNSVHNLSAGGPGAIKATTERDVCIFCHTVHHANGEQPLWNHNMSSVSNYVVYSSPTLQAMGLTVPQPNGSSRLCLSCHDGTIALGSVSTRTTTIEMQQSGGGLVTTMPTGPSNLGTDLSGDHPISFVYDSALAAKDSQIKDPSTLTGKVKLDGQGRMQCTACHNPHDNQFGNFLVMDNTASALCLSCHNVANWSGSAHAMSSQTATPAVTANPALSPVPQATLQALAVGTTAKPTTGVASAAVIKPASAKANVKTVAENGCNNCHMTHTAGGKQHLMKAALPEKNCLPCHSGSQPGTKNVAADFQKLSTHPITQNASAHTPKENVVNPSTRHVTCADCHNPHATALTHGNNPKTAGALTGVTGVSASGATVRSLNQQYELCFRCHGDSPGKGPSPVRRQFPETNTRLQFATSASSYHPVEAPGHNPNVPSLLPPWTASSTVSCTDCHNSDSSPGAGGTGANGPHGSIYAPLLERQLVLNDFTPETPGSYALCYKCHSRDSLLSNRSFRATNALGQDRGHRFHVVESKTACTTCHDSHGVQTSAHLINFNTAYVTPNNGQISYAQNGIGHGTCTLTCHGYAHNNSKY